MIRRMGKYKPVRAFCGGLLLGIFLVGGSISLDRLGIVSFAELFAATGLIRPNADATTNQGTATGCAGTNASCLDEPVTTVDTPDDTTDLLSQGNNDVDFFQMSDNINDVDVVTAITVHVYHREISNNMQLDIALFDNGEATQIATTAAFANRSVSTWDSHTWGGLSLTQSQLDTLHIRLQCTRALGGGKAESCESYAMYADIEYDPVVNVIVSAESGDTQRDLEIGTTSAYVGGSFVIQEQTASRNITAVTITESGSVDAATDLSNVQLWYDVDTTPADGYNCSDQAYDGDELQYDTGSTNFSAADGTATFSETVGISTSQSLCLYVLLDVDSTATIGDDLELSIADPSTDVSTTGVISPNTPVALPGTTILRDEEVVVTNFHWRFDNGNEGDTAAGAGSVKGSQDVNVDAGATGANYRLRYLVDNTGNGTSTNKQYRIEYGEKITSCSAIASWIDVGAGGGDWDMAGSGSGLSDTSDTTNISSSTRGAITDPGGASFLSPNGGQVEVLSQTGNISLLADQFVELEYAIVAAGTVSDGTTYCFRLTDAGATTTVSNTTYPEFTVAADITVSANGSQVSSISIPTSGAYNGGQFALVDNTAASIHELQSVTIAASGTVDLQNDISDIVLRYEYDTLTPYDCSNVSYNGTETILGTDPDGFSAGGTSTFSIGSTITASTTQGICLYVEYTVDAEANDGELIELRINNPSTDIVFNAGSVSPVGLLDLTGVTTLTAPDVVQGNYHWRTDGGDESDTVGVGALSATGGNQNTIYDEVPKGTTIRLRLDVSNIGGEASGNYQYRLEWARKISSCAAATGWTNIDVPNDEFATSSSQLVEGNNTTDVSAAYGGVNNQAGSFLSTNGGQREATAQTGNIDLAANQYTELEYAIQATASTTEGVSYCFRVTNAGTPLDAANYLTYPELNIKLATDFIVTRGVATIPAVANSVTITQGQGNDYVLQRGSSTRAFVRITNVMNTGAGPAVTGNNNAADVTAYISNPGNIVNNITFTRAGTAGTSRISWEVIEYVGAVGGENEIIVHAAAVATYGTAATTVTTPVTPVGDDTKVVPWITGQGNPDGGRFDYNTGISTSAWNAGADTATFTRGEAGADAVNVSYAIVEFSGINWNIQRISHTYGAAGSLESEAISPPVNNIDRTFLHVQKQVGLDEDQHADFGHEVYLQSMGIMRFRLDGSAQTPSLHTSVAWVIENTQTLGNTMKVWRSTDTISSGAAPQIVTPEIGTDLSDLSIASIFVNARADGTGRTFHEPIISANLLNSSTTAYELWVGDSSDNVTYATEVVEWPTANAKLTQNVFRLYVDSDTATVSDPWPVGATDIPENQELTPEFSPIATGQNIRIRMTLQVSAASLPANQQSFRLEYGERTGVSCAAIGESDWHPIGDAASTTALWRGNDATPVDGTALSTDPPTGGDLVLLSVADVAGTYEEENNTAVNPYTVLVGEDVEYDWNIQNNGANDKTDYCFRMVNADGSLLEPPNTYPVIRTVGYGPEVSLWQWFDDATSTTPTVPLDGAATNTAPSNVANGNTIKLRVSLEEKSGATGENVKFKLQFSEYDNFSDGGLDVVSQTQCVGNSIWCYADGAGVNNATITAAVLDDSDACVAGVGAGCGTHNEATTTENLSMDHTAFTTKEYEFTLENAGARVGAVYYFRLYNITEDEIVPASSTNPSLQAESANLVFTIEGIGSGIFLAEENVTTDVETTPTSISFTSIPLNTEYEAAQRISVETNATQGYQILMFADSQLTNTYGDPIPGVIGTNASPADWSTGCSTSFTGCFGYRPGDDTLSGGDPVRFVPTNVYAPLDNVPQEIMYSSVPATESSDIVYKIQIADDQPAGDYETNITYLAFPVY